MAFDDYSNMYRKAESSKSVVKYLNQEVIKGNINLVYVKI